jgi:hypothetical protein
MIRKTILYFIFTSLILANGKPTPVDNEIMELGLNYQFDKANQLLKSHYKNTDDLKYNYLYLNIELIHNIDKLNKVNYQNRRALRDSLNQKMITYTEKFIEIYEDYEDMNLSIHDRFYLGSIYGLMGRLYGVNRSWSSAFSRGKDGRNILQEVIKENPNYTDAYLLLGMMNYYVDRMGGFTEFIAGILGLSGDRKLGIEYLHKVMNEGNLSKWQATMILAELYARLENNKFDAIPILKSMYDKFPNNSHFSNWYCYELINLFRIKEAGEIIMADKDNEIYPYLKASYFNIVGDYEKSNQIYDTLLTDRAEIFPWVYNNNRLNHLLNYLMLDNKEIAKEIANTLEGNTKLIANQFLQDPSLTNKIIKFKRNLFLENNESVELLNNPPNFNGSKFFESLFSYYSGIYYYERKDFIMAEKKFLKAKELDFNNLGYDTIKYLIDIYKTTTFDKNSVESLIDDIDELENDAFEFSLQDLESKYDL